MFRWHSPQTTLTRSAGYAQPKAHYQWLGWSVYELTMGTAVTEIDLHFIALLRNNLMPLYCSFTPGFMFLTAVQTVETFTAER